MSRGVISSSTFRSCALDGSLFRSTCWPICRSAATCRCFEIALGEDLAVHLHQDLLDDFGAQAMASAPAPTSATSDRDHEF